MRKPLSLRGRAIALLARREHSRAELARKLSPHTEDGDDGAEIETLLNDLERRKLLSDQRYAEARAHTLARKFGGARIAHELRIKGVADTTVYRITADLKESEFDRAYAAWSKRFGTAPSDALERAKQQRFLQSRGFSAELIQRVMRAAKEE
ncbi:MAG TPA: recombination regulator RecX [Burkholderiales bacterium]|jgi:regulatory protein|nr:recombination regulator RecX [Burkholderiales bacterium]